MSLVELFCHVDDFWQAFQPSWHDHLLKEGERQRLRPAQLSESEIMTIMIHFHQSGYRTFKDYYTRYVLKHLSREFPSLVSYGRFVNLMPRVGIPLSGLSPFSIGISGFGESPVPNTKIICV